MALPVGVPLELCVGDSLLLRDRLAVLEALAPAVSEPVALALRVLLLLSVLEGVPLLLPVAVGVTVPLLLALAPRVTEAVALREMVLLAL